MEKDKDSALTKLVRGEGGLLWLSQPERLLLKYVLNKFGVPLSQFLCTGLGEEEERQGWIFSVTFVDSGDVIRRRDISVEADRLPDVITFLPREREPLVILALLRLFMSRDPVSAKLFYDQEEVLGLLGWQDTPSSRLYIDKAIERYADFSYRWTLSKEELTEKNLFHYRGWSRFIYGYGYRESEETKGEPIKRVSNRVDFSAEFVNELISRSLFDINWNSVRSLIMTKAK